MRREQLRSGATGLMVTALVFVLSAVIVTAASSTSSAAATKFASEKSSSDQLTDASDEHGHHAEPNYHYKYAVASRKTGDVKGAWEKRSGEDVWGAYFLRDPDGHWRTVHYEADHTGFHATVQRRPLYGRGRGKGQLEGEGQNLENGVEGAELDDAEWEDTLSAARESAVEENHPALLKGRAILAAGEAPADLGSPAALSQTDEGTSVGPKYSTETSPSLGAEDRSYAPNVRPLARRGPPRGAPHGSYYQGAAPSTRAPKHAYSSTRQREEEDDEERPSSYYKASSYSRPTSAYPEQPSVATSYIRPTSAYPEQPSVATSYSRPTSTYPEQPSSAMSYSGEEPSSYSESSSMDSPEPSGPSEEPGQYDDQADRAAMSEQYRVTPVSEEQHLRDDEDDQDHHHDDGYRPGSAAESYRDEDKESQEDDERPLEDADDSDNEHNPDDDHELVPEQALQGSQVRHEHESAQLHAQHLQQHQVQHQPHDPRARAPQQFYHPHVHVHHPQAVQTHAVRLVQSAQQPQLREVRTPNVQSAVTEQLLGPAWSEVASHSALFDGNDWPGLDGRPNAEASAQASKDVPTWVKKERAKARRAPVQAPAPTPTYTRVKDTGSERGPGRWPGKAPSPRQPVNLYTSTAGPPPGPPGPSESTHADWVSTQWSFGSKVRGKEDATPYPQPQAQPQAVPTSKRPGYGPKQVHSHNRGPVLFAHPVLEASTPAGERLAPPRGYVPATFPSRQHKQAVSYTGWVPVGASLQVAEPSAKQAFGQSFGQSFGKVTRGRESRGRGRASLVAAAPDEQSGASNVWKQSWS